MKAHQLWRELRVRIAIRAARRGGSCSHHVQGPFALRWKHVIDPVSGPSTPSRDADGADADINDAYDGVGGSGSDRIVEAPGSSCRCNPGCSHGLGLPMFAAQVQRLCNNEITLGQLFEPLQPMADTAADLVKALLDMKADQWEQSITWKKLLYGDRFLSPI